MTIRHQIGTAIALFALCGSAAIAGEPVTEAPSEPTDRGVAAGETAGEPQMLSLDELAEARGRTTIVVNNQTLMAITSGNTLGNYAAGTINLSDNALSSFNGVGNFLFNTGAQNNLQTGMSLTITIE